MLGQQVHKFRKDNMGLGQITYIKIRYMWHAQEKNYYNVLDAG